MSRLWLEHCAGRVKMSNGNKGLDVDAFARIGAVIEVTISQMQPLLD